MKLSEIELTDEQVAALLWKLNAWSKVYQQEEWNRERNEERAQREEGYYDRIRELARKTAQLHGPLEGVNRTHQANAAWESFVDCEGFYTIWDVDEHFSPHGSALWHDAWQLSYTEEIDRMRRENIKPVAPEELE